MSKTLKLIEIQRGDQSINALGLNNPALIPIVTVSQASPSQLAQLLFLNSFVLYGSAVSPCSGTLYSSLPPAREINGNSPSRNLCWSLLEEFAGSFVSFVLLHIGSFQGTTTVVPVALHSDRTEVNVFFPFTVAVKSCVGCWFVLNFPASSQPFFRYIWTTTATVPMVAGGGGQIRGSTLVVTHLPFLIPVGYPRDAPATVVFGEWFRFGKPRNQKFLFEKMVSAYCCIDHIFSSSSEVLLKCPTRDPREQPPRKKELRICYSKKTQRKPNSKKLDKQQQHQAPTSGAKRFVIDCESFCNSTSAHDCTTVTCIGDDEVALTNQCSHTTSTAIDVFV
ncbi:hypothetical protein LXL04_023727 [Taraxacum kok-saghyz]